VASFSLLSGEGHLIPIGGPKNMIEEGGEKSLPLLGIGNRFSGRPTRVVVTALTKISLLPVVMINYK
jgi:hypothetical protein